MTYKPALRRVEIIVAVTVPAEVRDKDVRWVVQDALRTSHSLDAVVRNRFRTSCFYRLTVKEFARVMRARATRLIAKAPRQK